MKLNLQKKLAAAIMRCSPKKIWCDPDSMSEIKESITKSDIKKSIGVGLIRVKPTKGVSRVRARKQKNQKKKGLRKGVGSRKGKQTARAPKKEKWMNKIRVQRDFLKELRSKEYLTPTNYRNLYLKAKGGFFRSKRHIKIYIEEHKLVEQKTDN
ncbi:50S ribosomal protein L19e [Candidatus Woesearchaeota archaeon]|jgi:large subunit ribosomal protein L19e|nr:50S ribosomal protein L19e [Candidatus Woesearchaeota archaeon]MBT6520301.1 50S ribosomal protein L19e [Candidatus Woesearchaeota archaeon]MBT7368253.1 50S ribosomal protein L19e [Candidatus Woesearchaeota archaeon]